MTPFYLLFLFLFIVAPSDPQNLVVELNGSAVTATWDTPSSPNGVVTYIINITSLDLATGSSAQIQETLMRNDNNRVVTLMITNEPHVQYTVSVQAMTGGGVSGFVMATASSEEGGLLILLCKYC